MVISVLHVKTRVLSIYMFPPILKIDECIITSALLDGQLKVIVVVVVVVVVDKYYIHHFMSRQLRKCKNAGGRRVCLR